MSCSHVKSHNTKGANGADRCTHAGDEYDAPPSIGNHNLGGFTSGEISPVDIDVK